MLLVRLYLVKNWYVQSSYLTYFNLITVLQDEQVFVISR